MHARGVLVLSLAFLLAFPLAVPQTASAQQVDTAAQILGSAHSVCVREKQSFFEGKEALKGIHVPAKLIAGRLLNDAGVVVTDAETKDTDLALDISVVGTSLSADYQLDGTLFTGARVEGSLLFRKGDERFPLAFRGEVPPPQEVTVGASGLRPFGRAFAESDFSSLLLQAIVSAFGTTPAVKALKDPEAAVRCAAAAELARTGDASAGEPLIPLLKDTQLDVRTAAAEALGRLQTPSAIAPLRIAFTTPANAALTEFRVTVVRALGSIRDKSVVPLLLGAMRDPDAKVREASASVLEGTGWVPENDQERVALAVAKGALDEAASYGATALPALLAMVWDSDPGASDAALSTLAKMNEPKAADALIRLARDRKTDAFRVRQSAIFGLGVCADARAFDTLSQLLADPDPTIIYAAEKSLGSSHDPRAVASLVALLKDKRYGVRSAASSALQERGWQPATDEEALAYYSAVGDWHKCASYGDAAIPDLLREARATGMGDPIYAICDIKTQKAVDALIGLLLKDPYPELRAAAANTLGQMRAASARDALKRAVKDPDPEVRQEAADALSSMP